MTGRNPHDAERSNAADLLATLGAVIVIALIVGLFVVMIGYALFSQMQQTTMPQE